jgi:hypothetical protein
VALIKVVPVHLIHPYREHFLISLINSFFDHPFINKFVDIEAGSVTEVEDEGVPEGFSLDVVGLRSGQNLEQFLVNPISLDEIIPYLFFQFRIVKDERSLSGKCWTHGLNSF